MAGRSSALGGLPLGNANDALFEMAGEILQIVKHTPVIAGVFAHDSYRNMEYFLKQLMEIGYSGVQNFPTWGKFDGAIERAYAEAGISYDAEVEMISIAHSLGMLTTPYVYDEEQTMKMTKAGADIVVAHLGGTAGGTIGWSEKVTGQLDGAAEKIQNIHDAAKSINPDVLVICHGGPIAEPEDMNYIMQHTKGIDGFYGASSMERLPVERAIIEQVKKFKSIKIQDSRGE
jgi:predicted TIM-barrel enzyme